MRPLSVLLYNLERQIVDAGLKPGRPAEGGPLSAGFSFARGLARERLAGDQVPDSIHSP